MSQEEVIEILKQAKVPLAAREIIDAVPFLNPKRIYVILDVLINCTKEVDFVEISRQEAMIKFHSKRRMKLYYLKK